MITLDHLAILTACLWSLSLLDSLIGGWAITLKINLFWLNAGKSTNFNIVSINGIVQENWILNWKVTLHISVYSPLILNFPFLATWWCKLVNFPFKNWSIWSGRFQSRTYGIRQCFECLESISFWNGSGSAMGKNESG